MDDKEKNKLIQFTESKSFKQRYEYVDYLGRGGFGVVIKCRKVKPDENGEKEEFALKVINKEKASKRYLNFLLNEARIHRTLKHPNIVEFYSVSETPNCPFGNFFQDQGVEEQALYRNGGDGGWKPE